MLDRYGLATAWDALFDRGASAAPFLAELDRFKRPVAIDWGFPPERLDEVRRLFEAGIVLWWFAADWAVARRKFELRRYPHVQAFDIQIRKIEANLPEINALFRSHVEYTLPSTGIYTPPDKIWESMIDTLAGPRPSLPRQKTALLSAISPQQPRRIRDLDLRKNSSPNHAKSVTQARARNSPGLVPNSEQARSKSDETREPAVIAQFCGIRRFTLPVRPPQATGPS